MTDSGPESQPLELGRQVTVFERVGGEPCFVRLVDEFYAGVADDDILIGLYPEPHDLEPAKERLRLFLMQYWGGPTTYSELRGHPRLRMRHFPFVIGEAERDAWLRHMARAVDSVGIAEPERTEMLTYFATAAEHLRNH